jgi:hypothetical protein
MSYDINNDPVKPKLTTTQKVAGCVLYPLAFGNIALILIKVLSPEHGRALDLAILRFCQNWSFRCW